MFFHLTQVTRARDLAREWGVSLMPKTVFDLNELLRNLVAPPEGRLLVTDIFIGLALSLLFGLLIAYIYKKTFQGALYSHSFSVSLAVLTLITSMVIMTIGINLVLTLGMVGALSIVRFRTALKDPLDIVFVFWSISTGLAMGAKLYLLAFIGAAFIGLTLIFLLSRKSTTLTFMLIIRYINDSLADKNVAAELNKLRHSLKSKTVARDTTELVVELRAAGEDTSFMGRLTAIHGVSDAVLVRYSGEHVS